MKAPVGFKTADEQFSCLFQLYFSRSLLFFILGLHTFELGDLKAWTSFNLSCCSWFISWFHVYWRKKTTVRVLTWWPVRRAVQTSYGDGTVIEQLGVTLRYGWSTVAEWSGSVVVQYGTVTVRYGYSTVRLQYGTVAVRYGTVTVGYGYSTVQ